MEERQIKYLTYASSLTDLCAVNSSFDSGTLRIAYTGDNQNHTSISKDVFSRGMPSIYGCPIVCNYIRETDSIGGHDIEVVRDDDGIRIVNITQPVGFIPQDANVWFEDVEEEDGSVHEYFCTEAILWKRQEAYKKIKRDGITSQSMEVTVKDGEMVDGVYHIYDLEFTAFCLLGDVKPCFESAALEFARQDFSAQFSEMMQEFKGEINSMVVTPLGEDNRHPHQNSTEGGNKVLNEKQELIAKYGIDINTLDFSIDDYSVEELINKFEEITAERAVGEQSDDGCQEHNLQYALTAELVDEIRVKLGTEKIETPYGVEARYQYIDCDLEALEVYAYDMSEHWTVYGFTFTKDGDVITIDFESKKRKKFAIVDYDEGEQASPIDAVFARAEQKILDNTEWEAKYNTASDAITSMESELNELREFKASAEAAEAEAKRANVFSKFADLEGIESFDSLRENCSELDIDALEEKCYAIRGRYGTQANFSLETKTPKLKVTTHTITPNEPYGGIVEEYLGKQN